ncbi:MAG: glycosyltransferase family 2 protein [Flavobacteriales bacterium]|nr:glycosyltransferase family 2 protein [Flavobacteriales bacterium]
MEVKVSVIIPVYNRSKDLIRAIRSVQNQTVQEFEVLVVDDKSEENIEKIVNEFADSRLKYFLNTSENSNANVCRNIGFDNAAGDYIAMLDSDDEWLPNH